MTHDAQPSPTSTTPSLESPEVEQGVTARAASDRQRLLSLASILTLVVAGILLGVAGLGAAFLAREEALAPAEPDPPPLASAGDDEQPAVTPAPSPAPVEDCCAPDPEPVAQAARSLPAAADPPPVKPADQPVAKPAAKPAPLEPLIRKRRDLQSEEALRQALASVPEVALRREELPRIVQQYSRNYSVSRGGNLEPSPVLGVRPEFHHLPYIRGDRARLRPSAAATLTVLSRKLRAYLEIGAPKDGTDQRSDPERLRETLLLETRGKRPEWVRPEAIPVMLQLLMHEARPVRLMLVQILDDINGPEASVALARMAVFDLSPEVREAALTALVRRPRDDYRNVFLYGLRYPWAPAADHAAEALVALQDRQAVPDLVHLLEKPEPNTPYVSKDRLVAREVVRINHQSNCLMCHPPAVKTSDPVPGLVPEVTLIQSNGGGGGGYGQPPRPATVSVRPLWVRADVAFVRQDFSILQTVFNNMGVALPAHQRFDFLVRTQPLTEKAIKRYQSETHQPGESEQRQSLLFALRELSGKDLGTTFDDWKSLAPRDPDAEAKILADQVVRAPAGRLPALLNKLKDSKGSAYTDALARAAAKLTGPARTQAREALAARLTRMTAATLRDKLQDEDDEIRRAAILACREKEDPAMVPDLIPLVGDTDPVLARLAAHSLKALTGQDFGPAADATAEEQARAAAAWESWWQKQAGERAETGQQP
jgi:HEAT repeat protein